MVSGAGELSWVVALCRCCGGSLYLVKPPSIKHASTHRVALRRLSGVIGVITSARHLPPSEVINGSSSGINSSWFTGH